MHAIDDRFNVVNEHGFVVIEEVYTVAEIEAVLDVISRADQSNLTFRKTDDLFAIRQFLKELPDAKSLLFNNHLKKLIKEIFGEGYFVVKSIYFDKPEESNWFVSWHQDLTISVDRKIDLPGFSNWTKKVNQVAVQPPPGILQNNFTIRIHLDDTDEHNGALKVIPGSHKAIERVENVDFDAGNEVICRINRGGIMLMRPLLMHSSNRTTSNKKRRVVHIEFSKATLPKDIGWAEKDYYN